MQSIVPVILCGGSGTRLWPLSRTTHPKQFVEFEGGETLFQRTVQRSYSLPSAKMPIVVCNSNCLHFVRQNLKDLNRDAMIIVEPEAKNTAPAIALAAITALKQNSEAILLVLPSDHIIKGEEAFQKAVSDAIELSMSDLLITFGIVPTGPETGFGYIEQGEAVGDNGFYVKKFVEKPAYDKAQEMLASGGFLWNSGMFVFKAKTLIDELKNYAYDVYDKVDMALAKGSFDFIGNDSVLIKPDEDAFCICPSDSIDYAVMEKTRKASVIPLSLEWNDMGAWSSFFHLGKKDVDGNVVHGDVVMTDTQKCYINSTNRLIATIGVENLAIVETKDAVFVSSLNRVQEVKNIVGKLKNSSKVQADWPPVVARPWGNFESLAIGKCYQTKRIIVRPGEQLSLQLHHHRSEHWIVVEGSPDITVGDKTRVYSPNESIYIPKECIHRLANHTNSTVTIIEVQCGDYLGEDDIERLEDVYGRIKVTS